MLWWMLEEDIVTLSDENRRLSDDLKAVLNERRQLSSQVQEYVTEVQRVENVIAQKVHITYENIGSSRLFVQYFWMTSLNMYFQLSRFTTLT